MNSLTSPSDPTHRLVALILFLVSCPFLTVGLYQAVATQQQLGHWLAAPGTIVTNTYTLSDASDSTSGAYYPIVEFTPPDRTTMRFTDGVGSLPPDYEVGAQVEVLYDPNNVKAARINSWPRLWLVPTLFIGIGLLPILIALSLVIVARRRQVS